MNDDITFVAKHYPARLHQPTAWPEPVAGHDVVNVAGVKAVEAVVTISSFGERNNFPSAMPAGENLVAGDEISTLVHEFD